jgi:hypothetical protein
MDSGVRLRGFARNPRNPADKNLLAHSVDTPMTAGAGVSASRIAQATPRFWTWQIRGGKTRDVLEFCGGGRIRLT